MKKSFLFFILIHIFTIGLFISKINAQLCIPNPAYTQPGVYPDTSVNLNTGCVGSYYLQDFTLVVPADTTAFGFTFVVNFMQIDSVGGLPPGMSYTCNPASCVYPGNSSGCFQIYGMPPAAGTYNLIFYIQGQAYHPIWGTVMFPYQFPGYQINVGSHPVLTTGNTPATCNFNNAMAWVSASGSSGYNYLWSTGSVNDTIFNQYAGIYSITVNDLYNCSTIDTVIINDLGAPTIDTIQTTNILCFGDSTATADVMVSGGSPGYSYLWSTGGTTATISNIWAGIYTIAVIDTNGCQVSSSVTITEPGQVFAFPSHTDPTCFGFNNGSAFVTAVGGIGTFDYSWSSGALTASAPSLGIGSYTVTVTDDNGCTATTVATLNQPTAMVLNISPFDASCFGGTDGFINLTASGGSPGYTYIWSNADTTAGTSNLSPGMYTVQVTDSLGCIALDTASIGSPNQILISLMGTNESMLTVMDGTVNATISGGILPYSFSWNNGDTTEDISNLAGGTYILTVTDGNGCIHSDTITILTLPGFGLDPYTNEFQIYPNPTSDYFYINVSQPIVLKMFDALGNHVMTRNLLAGNQMVPLPLLAKGIYFVYLDSNAHKKPVKLIIQ